jgi:hypothetical protein
MEAAERLWDEGGSYPAITIIARAIMAATEAERERCANVAAEFSVHWGLAYKTMTDQIADAIRTGTKGETA